MPFIEYVSPSAFDGVDLSRVQFLYNHDFANILARVDAGTLSVQVDTKGVNFTATLPNTQLGTDAFINVQNGNIQGLSFGFTIEDDTWSLDDSGNEIHTINQIGELYELSLTPIPAYPETSVAIERSLKQFRETEKRDMAQQQPDDTQNQPDASTAPDTTQQPDASTQPSSDDLAKLMQQLQALCDSMGACNPAGDDNGSQTRDDDDVDDSDDSSDDSDDDSGDSDDSDDSSDDSDDDDVETDALHIKNEKRDKMKTIKKPDVQRSNFLKYLKRDMSITGGTDTTTNGVALPHAVLQSIEKPANTNELVGLANHISVSAPAGTLPVLSATDTVLATAAELVENPQLAKMALSGVDYKLKTYRGAIPVSQELLDDADANVEIEKLIGDYATQIHDNTLNADIASALKTATASTVTSFDDFKKAYNDSYKYSNRVVVVTKSAYDALDTLKDSQGRYLLQDSIASETGKEILGAPVYIVEDTRLGAKDGDEVAFVGSVHSFVTVADFKDLRVKWTDDYAYGEQLQLIVREDTIVADPDAGQLLTLNFATSTASTGTTSTTTSGN